MRISVLYYFYVIESVAEGWRKYSYLAKGLLQYRRLEFLLKRGNFNIYKNVQKVSIFFHLEHKTVLLFLTLIYVNSKFLKEI